MTHSLSQLETTLRLQKHPFVLGLEQVPQSTFSLEHVHVLGTQAILRPQLLRGGRDQRSLMPPPNNAQQLVTPASPFWGGMGLSVLATGRV